jgi:hypothetical protein
MALKDDPQRGPNSYPARPWLDPDRYIASRRNGDAAQQLSPVLDALDPR